MANRPLELVYRKNDASSLRCWTRSTGFAVWPAGFGLAVVQSSLVFPVFSFGLGMLSLCCCLEDLGYRSPRMLPADLMGHFEGTLEAQNADSRGLVIRFLEATQSRNRLFSLFVSYCGKKKKSG